MAKGPNRQIAQIRRGRTSSNRHPGHQEVKVARPLY